jgi:N-methylhydantoinase B
MTRLDPITFELVHAALLSAAEEMGGVLKRSSYSPIIRDMEDFSCAIFAADGDLVAQADYIPAQLGAMSLVVRSILDAWRGRIADGDVFMANHPFLGAMHTPDINVIAPVFVGGELYAWTGATAHHLDVGGVNPGTEGAALEQVYAEGLVLAPVRLYVRGEENADVLSILTENIRDPRSTISDLKAQRAACLLGRRRLEETVERFGPATVRATFTQAMDVVERAVRASLRELPDGQGGAEGFMDDDGRGGPPTRIHVLLRKTGDRLAIDLSGSSPQVAGALNVPWASTRAALVYAVRALLDPALPSNEGILRAVDVTCPKGNVLNPNPPAAVSVRHNTCQRLADTIIRAAVELWPEKAVGSSSVAFFGLNIESVSPVTGRGSVLSDVVGGGTGAHADGDGIDGVDTYMSNVGLMPVEVAEVNYAVRIRRTELIDGSEGRGLHRGGMGIRRDYEILDHAQRATFYSEQTNPRFRPLGANGGGDARPARISLFDANGNEVDVPQKSTTTLEHGWTLRIETSGGGGYGAAGRRRTHKSR